GGVWHAGTGRAGVDGATVISDGYEVLGFGVKIQRPDGRPQVERVVVSEPVEGGAAPEVPPLQLGGTRHSSAAQFAQDQTDAVALVASQDGRFTIFAWSPREGMGHGHRVETLLVWRGRVLSDAGGARATRPGRGARWPGLDPGPALSPADARSSP